MPVQIRRSNAASVISMTPLIDVVFLLLIFFMVSTTFVRETQLKLDLPEANGEPQEVAPATIEIVIDRQGEYAVSGRMLIDNDKKTLVRALAEVRDPSQASPRVIITADANAAHQAVVRAMDAAGSVGWTQISLTTQQPQEED